MAAVRAEAVDTSISPRVSALRPSKTMAITDQASAPPSLSPVILRNLAIDGKTRQEIGRIELITTMLMQAFLNVEGTMSTNVDRLLPKVAGQALAMLTTENVHNCLVMLKEPELIKRLKTVILIHDDKYIYVAASLLRNLCLHARPELRESDLKELSHTLRETVSTYAG